MRTRWLFGVVAVALFSATASASDHAIEPIVSHIRRDAVESSAVAAVGYSKRLHALEIEFRDGLTYRYQEVPPALYRELILAESKARFYNRNIRGRFHCLRVRPRSAP